MIYVVAADTFACGHFRLIYPAAALAVAGHPVKLEPSGQPSSLKMFMARGRIRQAHVPEDCEVLVMQRPTSRFLPDVVDSLRKAGVSVVLDIDDDLQRIHPSNQAFRGLHPKLNALNNWHHTAAACERASLVTVTTPALAERYGSHGRVVVLPNCVPESYLSIPHADSDLVGWGGNVGSHPDDLQAVGPAIARLRPRFLQIGEPGGVARALGLPAEPESTGYVPLDEWPHALAKLGVGIAPLADTVFNAAKSHLKILEMSALGVPWVASDRVEYQRLHERGCGVVAARPKDWERELRILILDSAKREDLSAAGREVARELTVEANAWKWLEAWSLARSFDRVKLEA